jgi:hypothetical protein
MESLTESALISRLKAYYNLLPQGCMESLVGIALMRSGDSPSSEAGKAAYTREDKGLPHGTHLKGGTY